MATLLEARDLDFAYVTDGKRRQILRDVNLKIEAGDYVAIQGPSGSGKSTLFYLLGCLLRPTGGQVLLDGTPLGSLGDDEAAYVRNERIGFVFQQFHLLPRATVLDNILLPATYPMELHSRKDLAVQRAKAVQLAERLGLGALLSQRPSQLSGGEQQRVAVARALLNDAPLILADEPTGNLDSANAAEILKIFDELHAQGRTVVVITHDADVARRCNRVVHVRDGRVESAEASAAVPAPTAPLSLPRKWSTSPLRLAARLLPDAAANLARNRAKSLYTTLGIVIGIAAVLAMISLGQFAQRRVMEGFEALGVNKLVVRGYVNWQRQATDVTPVEFQQFDPRKDLAPLRRIFPAIKLLSPVLTNAQNTITAGGRSVTEGVRLRGVGFEYLTISNTKIAVGRPFTPHDVSGRSFVCMLGAEVATRLFGNRFPLDEMVTVAIEEKRAFPCRVIAVLQSQKSNEVWLQPDLQVLMPYTSYQAAASYWSSQINEFAVQVRSESEVELVGKSIKAYFDQRYGRAGKFSVDAEGTLVAQTKRFITIFAALLAAIAFLSLVVGGIGIHNMMLVSVTERIKEIGLRKAVGATRRSIKAQVLIESLLLCAAGGFVGIVCGIGATAAMIWAATRLIPDLPFEWLIDWVALVVSVGSIVVVGIASGLAPARRAEGFQVIEALRAE